MAARGIAFPLAAFAANGTLSNNCKAWTWVPTSDGAKTSTPVVAYSNPGLTTPITQGGTFGDTAGRRVIYLNPNAGVVVEVKSTDEATSYGEFYVPSEIDIGTDQPIVVDNNAALTALTAIAGLADNGIYETRGRSTERDGGQGRWIYDSASTSTANGGTVLAIDGGGAGRFFRLDIKDFYDPQWWGALGDGSTNDYSALVSACSTANTDGFFLDGKNKTYKINTGISAWAIKARNFVVNGVAVTANVALGSYYSAPNILTVHGADIWHASYAKTTLSGAGTRGDVTLTVTSESGFAAGDHILVHEAAVWGATGTNAQKSEFAIVVSTSANTLTLHQRIEGTYTTAATVRKVPAVDPVQENIKVIGGGDSLGQAGLIIAHCRSVQCRGIDVEECEYVGLGVWNCFSLRGGDWRFLHANETGLGYGANLVGTSNVTISNIHGYGCRIVVTTGGGLSTNYPIARNIQITNLHGYGCADALFNSHPGSCNVQITNYSATFHNDATTDGDGIVFQGSGLKLVNGTLSGTRRHGVALQPFGDGDGVERTYQVSHLVYRQIGTTNDYPVVFDNTNAVGSFTDSTVQIDHVDADAQFGLYVVANQNDIRQVNVSDCRIKSTSGTAHGMLFENTANGRIMEVMVSNCYSETTATAGLYPYYFKGASGSLISRARVVACTAKNGAHSIRADYATVDYQMLDSLTPVTGLYVAGTSGVFNRITGTATYDPASLADAEGATTTITVTGAALGNHCLVSNSLDLQGIGLTAYVSATDTVAVRFQNETTGVIDLASATLSAVVFKAF